MTQRIAHPLALACTGLLLAASGCAASEDEVGRDGVHVAGVADIDTKVSVSFQDSSVAPEFHRSWTLEVDREQIVLVVDSYGEKVARESSPMPADLWRQFRTDLGASLDDIPTPLAAEMCPGGTALGADITDAGDDSLDAAYDVASSCEDGTKVNDEVIDDLLVLVEPFTDRVHLDRHTQV